jgi:hypothetical protein
MLLLRSFNVISDRFNRSKEHEIIINKHNTHIFEKVFLQNEMVNIKSTLFVCSLQYTVLVKTLLVTLEVITTLPKKIQC